LEEIHAYLLENASAAVAERTTDKILNDMDLLRRFPRGAQVETLLAHLGMGHRRMVSGNYKIIYRIEGELVVVTDIFDARQDPEKMAW